MQKIAEILAQSRVVRVDFSNPFVWSSGLRSPIYCDCRELLSLPAARHKITTALAQKISTEKFPIEAIAGTATAGIPWASFVAQSLDLPLLYVRSKPKGHGTGKRVEGRLESGKNIIVIEDALSTAGSALSSVTALRSELKATTDHVFAVFSWDTPLAKISAEKAGVKLHPLTTFGEIITALQAAGTITQAEAGELERFRENPAEWGK